MLIHIYNPRPGDEEILVRYKEGFSEYTKEELIKTYNSQLKCGIVGVHQQGLMLIALRQEFLKVFGESPVKFEDNHVLSLSGKARLVGGKLVYETVDE